MAKQLLSRRHRARTLLCRALIPCTVAFSLAVATNARAQSEDEEQDSGALEAKRTEAKMRYEEGAQAYKEGRYKDAVDLFLEADRLLSSAPLSFNIARAYDKLGDNSGALQWYRDYVRRDPQAKNAADVQKLIEALERKLVAKGVQQMTVRSRPRGATVLVDDQPVGITPWTGDLPPGKHRVTLRLKGYAETSRELELPVELAVDTEVRLVPTEEAEAAPTKVAAAPTSAPVAPPPEQEKSSGLGPWPYITLGAGGAVLGGALVFELMRRSSENAAKDEPTQIGYADQYDTMHSRQTVARVLTGVGGALVVAGGVMLVIELSSHKSKESAALNLGCDGAGCRLGAQGKF